MANMLYNGAELPVLPDYDQAAYPYAILFYHRIADVASDYGLTTTDGYVASLNVCSKEGGVNATGVNPDYYCVQAPFNDIVYLVTNNQEFLDLYNSTGCSLVLGEWCILDEGNFTGSHYEATPLPIHWANFDVKNADGSVYLAASDPVSVGSVTASAPAYIGDAGGIARQLSHIYIGDAEGVAHKALKAYVGSDDGTAALWWGGTAGNA